MSATFRCGCGCGTLVSGIYCATKREAHRIEQSRVAEERRARMSDPEYQAMLRAARAEARKPAAEE